MLYVNVKDSESLDKALKKFKKKFEKTGVVKEIRSRMAYEKPCVLRRQEIIRAKYRQQLKNDGLI